MNINCILLTKTLSSCLLCTCKLFLHYHLQAPPPLQPEYHRQGNRERHQSTGAWRTHQTSGARKKWVLSVRLTHLGKISFHNSCYLFAEFDPLWCGGRRSEGIGPITGQNLSSLCTTQTLKKKEGEETNSLISYVSTYSQISS